MGTNVIETESSGLELFPESTVVQDGSLALRWCVGKGVLDDFKSKGITNLYILIICHYTSSNEIRYLVPLEKMMTYISFCRPGMWKVFATIVWGNYSNLHDAFLRQRSIHQYHKFYVSTYGLEYDFIRDACANHNGSKFKQESLSSKIEIQVPVEVFAPNPPAWEQAIVNFGFEFPPVDQCAYRRRRLLTYTVKWPFIILAVIFNETAKLLFSILGLCCGLRNMDFKPLLHPLRISDGKDIWLTVNSSIFWPKYKSAARSSCSREYDYEYEYEICHFWSFTFFAPIIFIPLVCLTSVIWKYRAIQLISNCGLLLATMLVCFILMDLYALFRKKPIWSMFSLKEKKYKKREKEIKSEQARVAVYYKNLKHVACTGLPVEAKISALPPQKRTFYLRYLGVKSKVCRPFAR